MGDVYVATRSGIVVYAGVPQVVTAGKTTVREGHPLLAGNGDMFKRQVPDHEWTDADAEAATSTKRGRGRPPLPRNDDGSIRRTETPEAPVPPLTETRTES